MTDFRALHDAENSDFSAFLHTLDVDDWERPTLCTGWRVRDVVGHILYGQELKLWTLPWKLARFGLSWQIVPKLFYELMADPDPAKVQRVMQAMFKMRKLDCAELQRAADAA